LSPAPAIAIDFSAAILVTLLPRIILAIST
jgi:hypothetical protein